MPGDHGTLKPLREEDDSVSYRRIYFGMKSEDQSQKNIKEPLEDARGKKDTKISVTTVK